MRVVRCRPVAAAALATAALATAMAATVQVGAAHAASEPETASESPVAVQVASRIDFAPVPVARYGSPVTVRGKVTSIGGEIGLGATDVQLTFDPVKGASRTVTVRTDADGNFVARHTPRVRTTVRAVTTGSALVGATSGVSAVLVEAPLVCTVGKVRTGDAGWEVPGRCKVFGLPAGTKFRIQQPQGGVWRTVSTGRSKADRLSFVVDLPHRGTHSFRVYVFPDQRWVATPSQTFRVYV
jgi:hypothetical protein